MGNGEWGMGNRVFLQRFDAPNKALITRFFIVVEISGNFYKFDNYLSWLSIITK